ncbi:MAG: ornithine carbamoyltransferase [Candidatus Omnitrophota bacterium]|nr:MAG: ornithine carbamoyltransferase [Candidatus Omnitrophota bacterium]
MKKHFISLKDYSPQEIRALCELTSQIKKAPQKYKGALSGKCVGLLFQEPSLRTKTAFYVGVVQLGGEAVYYNPQEIKLGEREKISDVAKTISLYLDAVVLRTFSHKTVLEFAKFSSIPVVNGLTELFHPSQVLADVVTIIESKKDPKKIKVVFIGDGNNVCNSLIYAISLLGGNLVVATPKKYAPQASIVSQAHSFRRKSGASIELTTDACAAAQEADVLYTDVWTSMGREKEESLRKKVFKNYQINDKILELAKKNCIVMHCLPAHRGQEITDSVIDGKNSVVFEQAENRLHAAKAILVKLLKK